MKIQSAIIWGVCLLSGLVSAQQPDASNFAAGGQPQPTQSLERYSPQFATTDPNDRTADVGEPTVRIKDITSIAGHRSHYVKGFGLVNGLSGTGSNSELTQRLARNFLRNSILNLETQKLESRNLSVVTLSAEIEPFLRSGEKFDVRVAAFDNATSLYNGNLMLTELTGIDGQVYALAQGPITMGGFSATGDAASISKNHVTIGSVQAQLEIEICQQDAFPGSGFQLLLRNKDYATAARIASRINLLVPGAAIARNAGTVDVAYPRQFLSDKLGFVVMVNGLDIRPDIPARVIVNQKTGTIVVGHKVRISKVMFANSNLVITTNETPIVSQPNSFSDGETVVVPRTQLSAREIDSRYNVLNEQPTVGDLATALNTLGVTPQDLISILHSLKASGSLQAELIVQ